MKSALLRYLLLFFVSVCSTEVCMAGFPVKKVATTLHKHASLKERVGYTIAHVTHPFGYAQDEPVKSDGYKGILSFSFGTAGFVMLIVALAASAPILVLPAFVCGVLATVFGSSRKRANRVLGFIGLSLGILDIALVLLFLIALLIAISLLA